MKYSITIILISSVMSIIIAGFLLIPTISNFIKVRADVVRTEAKLETQNEFLSQLKITGIALEENKEVVSKIENALPLGPDVASLLDFLDESAMRNGVSLEDITWLDKNTTSETRVQDYVMSISFTGSYYAFRNFIADVEKSSRIIDINQIEFSSQIDSGLPIEFKLYLKIHSYK